MEKCKWWERTQEHKSGLTVMDVSGKFLLWMKRCGRHKRAKEEYEIKEQKSNPVIESVVRDAKGIDESESEKIDNTSRPWITTGAK